MEKSIITRNSREFLTQWSYVHQIYFTSSMLRTIFWQCYRGWKGWFVQFIRVSILILVWCEWWKIKSVLRISLFGTTAHWFKLEYATPVKSKISCQRKLLTQTRKMLAGIAKLLPRNHVSVVKFFTKHRQESSSLITSKVLPNSLRKYYSICFIGFIYSRNELPPSCWHLSHLQGCIPLSQLFQVTNLWAYAVVWWSISPVRTTRVGTGWYDLSSAYQVSSIWAVTSCFTTNTSACRTSA